MSLKDKGKEMLKNEAKKAVNNHSRSGHKKENNRQGESGDIKNRIKNEINKRTKR
ncbi:MAG TPA: hypothetical protein VF199_14350 [Bacillales bacterium]